MQNTIPATSRLMFEQLGTIAQLTLKMKHYKGQTAWPVPCFEIFPTTSECEWASETYLPSGTKTPWEAWPPSWGLNGGITVESFLWLVCGLLYLTWAQLTNLLALEVKFLGEKREIYSNSNRNCLGVSSSRSRTQILFMWSYTSRL